mmetsp:Transcript_51879/g.144801  ORF Transcript_51879/g.144801 Transcript_51879/m.144801 type:complete len:317 (-) Transcript_51879:96-1046(-)
MPRTTVVASDDEAAGSGGSEVDEAVSGSSPSKYRTSTTHRKTMELLASIGGSAAPSMPSDKALRDEIMNVLTTNRDNLDQWNAKMIRHAVETKLDVSLKERRSWVRDVVRDLISEHFTADSDEAEADEEETMDLTGVSEGGGEPAPTTSSAGLSADGPDGAAKDGAAADAVATPRAAGTMGLIMPARMPKGPTMLVQLASTNMSFSGDTGAIGRITVVDDGVTIDLHGSQYAMEIRPAPTLMVVNVTNPTTAKIETMVDEYCELKDGEDMMERMGERVGAGANASDSSDEEGGSSKAGAKSKGKGKGGGAKKKQKR